MTITFRRGTKLAPKYLTAVLQDSHDRQRASQAERIAKREKNRARGVPPTDEEPCGTCGKVPEETPIGDYKAPEHLDGLRVTFRSISLSKTRGYRLRQLEAMSKIDTSQPQTLIDAEEMAMATIREAAAEMVAAIDGLATEDGADLVIPAGDKLTDDELDLLEDNALLDHIFAAGLHLQDLTDEARKNCGASRRSTSARSTVTPAHQQSALAEVVTESMETGGQLPTSGPTMTATTPPASAPNGSSSVTPGSALSSSSSPNSAMPV